MDMALTGIKHCKSPVPDTKKQNNRSIFQPLRLLSSATSTMHQSKTMDFPFVPLTGHKLVDGPCISTNFDIMNSQANFGDFLFDKGNNFTKNTSLKGCNQLPMISISQLVGGFVGSKSQFRTKNRESHQIWDIVFQKLDEFITSRTTEKYSQHCYGFPTLSQDIIGSFYEKSNSALGFAASYILADECQSFKNNKNIENIANSSPVTQSSAEVIPTTVDTSISLDSFVPSHSSSSKSSVPVVLDIVEQFISQPDLSHPSVALPSTVTEPLDVIGVDSLVRASSSIEDCVACNNLSEESLILDSCQKVPSPVLSEVKQSYAEVAKMAQIKPNVGRPRSTPSGLMCSSKQYRKISHHNFSRNYQDSRQRCGDSSNWRKSQGAFSGQKERRRDINKVHLYDKIYAPSLKYEQNSKTVPTRISQSHRRKNHEGLKHFKQFKGSTLKTVPEMPPRSTGTTKEMVNGEKSFHCNSPTSDEYSCQFSNLSKKSCTNWRCRQHLQKSNIKRNMKHVLKDNVILENLDDQTNSDLSPSPTESATCIRLTTLQNYMTIPPNPSPTTSNGLKNCTQTLCDSKSEIQSLPIVSKSEHCMATPVALKDDAVDIMRPSKPSDGCVISLILSPRSLSESSESVKSAARSRSISEESRASSSSTSSLNSCKLMTEANFRRRFSSECDSEDSFVIFEGGVDCDDYDLDSVSDSSEEISDSEGEDEVDSCSPRVCLQAEDFTNSAQSPKLQEVTRKWGINCLFQDKKSCKKVRFAPDVSLATVHPMVKWDFAYRAARCGPWEEMARDRERFKQRVERAAPFIAPVLEAAHRDRIAALLRAAGRHDVASESVLR